MGAPAAGDWQANAEAASPRTPLRSLLLGALLPPPSVVRSCPPVPAVRTPLARQQTAPCLALPAPPGPLPHTGLPPLLGARRRCLHAPASPLQP